MNEMIKRKKDGGFTLIELMIVIAVIGILAVVLVPKVGSIKTQAKSAGVDTNVRVVEGFVQSRISYWANNGTAPAAIQSEIGIAFTANKIKNPISLLETVVTTGTQGNTNALQVRTANSGTIPLGGVRVVIPTTTTLLNTTGIIITGYDANGSITTTSTIKP